MITFSDQAVLRFLAEWRSSAQAPSTTTDWHGHFSTDPPLSELSSVRYCFDAGAGVDKNVSKAIEVFWCWM